MNNLPQWHPNVNARIISCKNNQVIAATYQHDIAGDFRTLSSLVFLYVIALEKVKQLCLIPY